MTATYPHGSSAVVTGGTPLERAAGAMILLHGRGASADDILGLGQALAPANWALLAPQAAGHTWYPYSFLAPRQQNEPYLGSALAKVAAVVATAEAAGLRSDHLVVCGFSQGACLASEFVGRNPRRYGGLVAFTGGLIGPPGEPMALEGNLHGTPVLLSSGDPDPHVPWARVEQTGQLLEQIGGMVTLRRYPGRPHTVTAQELEEARTLLNPVFAGG